MFLFFLFVTLTKQSKAEISQPEALYCKGLAAFPRCRTENAQKRSLRRNRRDYFRPTDVIRRNTGWLECPPISPQSSFFELGTKTVQHRSQPNLGQTHSCVRKCWISSIQTQKIKYGHLSFRLTEQCKLSAELPSTGETETNSQEVIPHKDEEKLRLTCNAMDSVLKP